MRNPPRLHLFPSSLAAAATICAVAAAAGAGAALAHAAQSPSINPPTTARAQQIDKSRGVQLALSVPVRARNRYFYLENGGPRNQTVLFMREGLNGRATIILDPGAPSAEGRVSISDFKPSPNANFLAYSLSVAGTNWTEIRLRDLRRGVDAVDTLKWVRFSSIAWTRDSEGFFYSRYDAPRAGEEATGVPQNQKLYYHRVGEPQSADILILERPDAPDLEFAVDATHDGELAIITARRGSDPHNMVYLIDLAGKGADRVRAPVVRLIDRFVGSFRFIHADSLTMYFLTDYLAPRGRIVRINVEQPREEFWNTVLAEGPNTIEDVTTIGGTMLVHSLRAATSHVTVHDARGVLHGELELPGPGTVQQIWGEPDQREGFVAFTSSLNQPAVYLYDSRSLRLQLYKTPQF
jgi:prolyl oligopeptidase